MSTNTARMILLFVAIYNGYTLTISQNAAGRFVISEISAEGTDSALTNYADVLETISECLMEETDGECQVKWVNYIFRSTIMAAIYQAAVDSTWASCAR